MVRVSGLLGEVEAGVSSRSPDGMTPTEELDAVRPAVQHFLDEEQHVLEGLLRELAQQDLRIVEYDSLPRTSKAELDVYFRREICPSARHWPSTRRKPFPLSRT